MESITLDPGVYLHSLDALSVLWTHDDARLVSLADASIRCFGHVAGHYDPDYVSALAVDPVCGEHDRAKLWADHASLFQRIER